MAHTQRRPSYLRHFLTAPTHTVPQRYDQPEFWVGAPPEPSPWGQRRPHEYKGESGVGRKKGGPRYAVNPADEIKPKLAEMAAQHCSVSVRKNKDGKVIAYSRACTEDEILNFLWKHYAFQEDLIRLINDSIYAALHRVAQQKPVYYEDVMKALRDGFSHAIGKFKDRLTPYNAWKYYDVTIRPIARSLRAHFPERKKAVSNPIEPIDESLASLTADNLLLTDALSIWFGPNAADIIQNAPFDVVTFLVDPTDYPLNEDEIEWVNAHLLHTARVPYRGESSVELAESYRIKDYNALPNFFTLYDKMGGYDSLPDWSLTEIHSELRRAKRSPKGKLFQSSEDEGFLPTKIPVSSVPRRNPDESPAPEGIPLVDETVMVDDTEDGDGEFDCECTPTSEPMAESNPFQSPSFARPTKTTGSKPAKPSAAPKEPPEDALRFVESYPWLPLELVEDYEPFAALKSVSLQARSEGGFLPYFKRLAGNSRSVSRRWLEKRDSFIRRQLGAVEQYGEDLFDARGFPTRRHLSLIMWAFSPAPVSDLKKALKIRKQELEEIAAEEAAKGAA